MNNPTVIKTNHFCITSLVTHPGGNCLVTKREALEEQTSSNLQKIVDRLGIRVSTGLSGALTQAMFGPVKPSRRQYIETLANSDLVTLEDIDRILHTHYARLPDDARGIGYTPRPVGPLSGIFMQPRPDTRVERFATLDSLTRHTLDSYVDKSGLQKICQQLGLPATGNRGDLVERIVVDSDITGELALNQVNRDDMKKLCVDLKLPTIGTRGDMESRVAKVMARLPRSNPTATSYEPPRYIPPSSPPYQATSYSVPTQRTPTTVSPPPSPTRSSDVETPSNQNDEREQSTRTPDISASPLPTPVVPLPPPVPSIPACPEFDGVVRFIEDWEPTKPHETEEGYQLDLEIRLRTAFGEDRVKTQLHVLGGRIDLDVMGIGIELKVPTNMNMLRSLIGQARMYRRHYGPNLVLVIMSGRTKLQNILQYKTELEDDGFDVILKRS
jgi:hypothetical protein